MLVALTAASLITPTELVRNAVLIIRDGKIETVGPREQVEIPIAARVEDYESGILAPGYIDLHIHGASGHDLMEATPAAMEAVERTLWSHGVTSYLPTTLTAPIDLTLHALEFLAACIEAAPDDANRTRPAGIHMEGPFLSHAKRGVHPLKFLQVPSVELFERFWQTARGNIKLITIAPELPNAPELIARATQLGVTCSIGHSNATAAEARAGIAAGARHATHTFNAMRPLDHREPGILGTVLTCDELYADLIADGFHVTPAVVEMFLRLKGPERAVLITDALSATGMGDGPFKLADFEVEVRGVECRDLNGTIAGSVLTLDLAVRNIMSYAGWELAPTVRLASMNAARSARLSGKGELVTGADADVIVLSPTGEVIETICGGQLPS